jgi:HlyD family secretion protein
MNTISQTEPDMKEVLNGKYSSKSHKYFKKGLLALIVIFAVILILGFLKKSTKSKNLEFKTKAVRRGGIVVSVMATGTLEPTNNVEVGSELSGIIETVEANYNSIVKKDQVLARLNTSKLQAQVAQSKASLETAKARVLQAKATLKETESKLSQFKKVRELSNNKVPSQANFDTAEAAYERAQADLLSAQAGVLQAKATLDLIEADLHKAVIRSPINGIVLTREVEEGQTVAASFATPVLFRIAEDLKEMNLHVNVDEADIGQIQIGQKATFTVDAYPDRIFHAQITEIHYAAEAVNGVVTYETVLEVDNSDLSLRPGMTATADIVVLNLDDSLLIPNSALRFKMPDTERTKRKSIISSLFPVPPGTDSKRIKEFTIKPGQYSIWILKNGKPVTALVTTGVTDNIHTQIVNGELDVGMEVIVSTLHQDL